MDLKPTAARMRYSRLAKAIEKETLNEKNGATFDVGSDEMTEVSKKRKTAKCDMEENDTNQNTVHEKDPPAPEFEDLHDSTIGGTIPLDDKTDGTPAAKKRAKVSKKKPTEKISSNVLAGSKINRTKSMKSDTRPSAIEGPSQDTNAPSSELPAAPEGPGQAGQHLNPASQGLHLPKAKRGHSMSTGQVKSEFNGESDLDMESYSKWAPEDGSVDLSYKSTKKGT